jgi:hypothetical protein
MQRQTHVGDPAARQHHPRPLHIALLIMTLAIVAGALFAPAALADGTYLGGPRVDEFPLYVANDHSVYFLRFGANVVAETPSLLPSTQYYYKIRLSKTQEPLDAENRGFTWNGSSGRWVQEREDWTHFPTITTGSNGAFSPGDTWYGFKFGDTAKAGTYYLFVSLRQVGVADAPVLNNASPPAVTVIDPAGTILGATKAFWVHNGIATAQAGGKRADAIPVGGTAIWSLGRTEPNGVDDDGNGVVDDEDHGPAGNAGDFSLAVPVGKAFNVRIGAAIWPLGAPGFTGSIADVDIAYGAADQIAPARVTGLTATAGEGIVSLAWDAAPDADGVTQYRIYRWGDPVPVGESPYTVLATQYTSQPVLVGTSTGPSFEDTSVTNGEDYSYHVRAADEATNIGPRSKTVAASPGLPSTLTLNAAATIVPYKGTTTLTVHLTDDVGGALAGHLVDVQKSLDGIAWTTFATVESDGGTATTPVLTRAMKFRAVWEGVGEYARNTSAVVTVKPKVYLGAPVAPLTIKEDVAFVVYGALKPRHTPGWNEAVKLYCYRKNADGVYVLKKTVWCKTIDYSTYSRYWVKLALPTTGTWKLRAFAPQDKLHAATWSSSIYRKVR